VTDLLAVRQKLRKAQAMRQNVRYEVRLSLFFFDKPNPLKTVFASWKVAF
jgi:hypothetical protein